MPPFKDDQIIIIAPGSHTTLAQLGLPESFTPARLRVRSRMFPAEREGEWEPYKVRRKEKPNKPAPQNGETNGEHEQAPEGEQEEEVEYEEDFTSDEGAVYPIADGRIVNWPCFFALITHAYNSLSPPFHTPILLIAQPCWTPRDHERLTQFFFEKFKMPAFALMDAAVATCYAYGTVNATVVDIGYTKADITAVCEVSVNENGRTRSLPGCGGEAMTQRLLELLSARKFTRDMCEQLKLSPICEILPPGTTLPGSDGSIAAEAGGVSTATLPPGANPAAAASTGAATTKPGAGAASDVPLGPGPDTQVGEEGIDGKVDDEGVLDVASIVASGKMSEYLAQKEKEKQDKLASKASHKKGTTTTTTDASKPLRLPNSKRDRNTFLYEDHALTTALKDANLGKDVLAEAHAALDEGPQKRQSDAHAAEPTSPLESNNPFSGVRREVTVGSERFQAASGGILERIADAIFRTVSSVEDIPKRSELWDNLIIVGNGSRVRGFKEALLAELNAKYLVSPSSATIFTSQLPSNLSTPTGTGANTPQPGQLGPHGGGSGVNPLLFAATAGQNPYLAQQQQQPLQNLGNTNGNVHSAHGQTPTSMKLVKVPEYFPEWKDAGYEEAVFLGAQVAAKVLFVVDQGLSNGFMSRTNYNAEGPTAISEYAL